MSADAWRLMLLVSPIAFGLGVFAGAMGTPIWQTVLTGVAIGVSVELSKETS